MKIITTLLILSVLTFAAATAIVISAPHYVQKGSPIRLTCSSNNVPVGRTAEFLTAGSTVANIRSQNGYCFNTLKRKECTKQSCICLEGGKIFVLFYMPRPAATIMTFQCKMKYKDNIIHLSNTVTVFIIDMMTPKIDIDGAPLISGMAVNMQCTAPKTSEDVIFSWECGFGLQSRQIDYNETSVWSTMVIKVDSTYDGKSCTCRLHSSSVNFSLSDTIILKIKKMPILSLNEEYQCNKSDSVLLICSVMGELGIFGFDPWIHSVNGVYIRSLKGVVNKYVSLLMINQCRFEDFGYYTCNVWNENLNETLWANKTTYLSFNGPPVIRNKSASQIKDNVFFNFRFYSDSQIDSVDLSCNDNEILSTNHSNSLLEYIPIHANMHGTLIELIGYKASFRTMKQQHCDGGKYTICVENEYSKTCQYLQINADYATDRDISWFIFGGTSAVIIIIIVITLAVYFVWRKKSGSNVIEEHQEVIAPPENYIQGLPPQNDNTDVQVSQVQHESEEHNTVPRPYNDLQPYQSSRVYNETIPEYLEVLPDIDAVSKSSDGYEKVE